MSDQYTIDDFKKGDFVELHNDEDEERWFGMITRINKKRANPLSVHYLKKISGRKWPNLPEFEDLDYYAWWEIQTGDEQIAEYWTEIDCVIQVGKLFRPVKLDPGLDVPTKTLYLLTLEAKDRAVEDSPSEEEEVNPIKEAYKKGVEEAREKRKAKAKKKPKKKLKPKDLGTKPATKPMKSISRDFYDDDQPCLKCGATDRPDDFVLCDGDGCDRGGHFDCFGLDAVPAGEWFCPDCTAAKEKTKGVVEQIKQVEAEGEELGKKVLGTLGSQAILETPTGPESEVIGTLGSQEETPTGTESEDEIFQMRHVADHDWEKVHAAVMPPPPSPGTMPPPPPPKKRPATAPLRRSDRQAGTPAKKVTSPEPQEYTEEKYEVYNKQLWKINKMYLGDDLYKPFEHPDEKLRHPCLYVCDVPRPPNKGGGVDHYYRRFDMEGNLQEFVNCDEKGNYKRGENQIELRSLEALTRHMEKFLFP